MAVLADEATANSFWVWGFLCQGASSMYMFHTIYKADEGNIFDYLFWKYSSNELFYVQNLVMFHANLQVFGYTIAGS